ncbi:N,N-dimethylformamidase beta subunit family domain-containing protein [Streptomyces sp. NPDC058240]|uniref:N,N-dimethylformamidase beta subunit family domain-containing protein n=1 Tax=Streptomyces sp. NPDC058240 TaxID=3346396 RepID=UPI0036E59937
MSSTASPSTTFTRILPSLDGYACAVIVGHDEYWTWEMRDAVDRFTDGAALRGRLEMICVVG